MRIGAILLFLSLGITAAAPLFGALAHAQQPPCNPAVQLCR